MHSEGQSRTLFIVALVLLAGLVAGCGRGDQSGNGSQEDASGGAEEQGGGGAARGKGAPEAKIALGTIVFVNVENARFSLRPNSEVQGEKPIPFKLGKNAKITLDGQETELADIERGQQAQIEYLVRNERNVARRMELFEGQDGEQPSEGGEKTG